MITRRPATHTLTVQIPLAIEEGALPRSDDVVFEALRTVLAVSRAAYQGLICDTPEVTLVEASS